MKRSLPLMAGLAVCCLAASLAPAWGDTIATMTTDHLASPPAGAVDTMISIPWGDMLYSSASFLIMVAGVVITWGMRFLPAQASALIKNSMLDQLLLKAIAYGINTTAGAAHGKALEVNVGNAVVAQALQYALDHAPQWAIHYAGGAAMLEQKIIARLNVAPEVAVAPSQ